jgi:hypothetical protein
VSLIEPESIGVNSLMMTLGLTFANQPEARKPLSWGSLVSSGVGQVRFLVFREPKIIVMDHPAIAVLVNSRLTHTMKS